MVFTALAVGTWWRDNFASAEWQRRLALKGLTPHWHPAWWVCIGLVVIVFVVIRASHRLWLIEHAQVEALEKQSVEALGDFPKVLLSYQDHDVVHQPIGNNVFIGSPATVRNVSKDKTVFNVEVQTLETPHGKATFSPRIIDHIPAQGNAQVTPRVDNASALLMQSIGYLLSKSYEDKSLDELFEQKPFAIRVHYDDGANNRFEAECTLLYTHHHHQITMGRVRYKRISA